MLINKIKLTELESESHLYFGDKKILEIDISRLF